MQVSSPEGEEQGEVIFLPKLFKNPRIVSYTIFLYGSYVSEFVSTMSPFNSSGGRGIGVRGRMIYSLFLRGGSNQSVKTSFIYAGMRWMFGWCLIVQFGKIGL